MKAAEALVQIIEKEGVRTAFGIPGAGINPVYKYLKDAPIAHYCMRHEEACTHAADAYYRASHEIALAICTSGPGATNFVTGLYTACIDSIPMLAVTGQANTWQLNAEPFQCVDIASIAKTVTKAAWCVKDAAQLPEIMKEAFRLMREGRPGPVLIDFPLDAQMAEIDFDIAAYQPAPLTVPAASQQDIDKALDMIAQAKAPVFIMGGGVVLANACEPMRALAEYLNVPVVTTYMAKGGMPENHPLSVGHVGIQVGQPYGNKVFLASDLVIGIGCRFSDRHTGALKVYQGERKFIHIDIEPSQIGRVFQPDLGIVSDAGKAIDMLTKGAKARGMGSAVCRNAAVDTKVRAEMARKTDYDVTPIKPHRVFDAVNKVFGTDAHYTAGCGITQIWGGQLQQLDKPMQYLPSGGAGTLGFEVPGAFGAKVACPDQPSVTVVGDFGFTFMGEEVAVAAVYNKPIVIVILNNAYLGLIAQNQKGAYGYEYEVAMPYNQDGRIDYLKIAQGYGCEAERVTDPAKLEEALQRAKASKKCYVLDVICDPQQRCDMGGAIDSIKSFI